MKPYNLVTIDKTLATIWSCIRDISVWNFLHLCVLNVLFIIIGYKSRDKYFARRFIRGAAEQLRVNNPAEFILFYTVSIDSVSNLYHIETVKPLLNFV